MVFRLNSEDFCPRQNKKPEKTEKKHERSGITLNDLSPSEWEIVTMVREAAGTHGRLITGDSLLAKQCLAPPVKPIKDAFDKRRTGTGG